MKLSELKESTWYKCQHQISYGPIADLPDDIQKAFNDAGYVNEKDEAVIPAEEPFELKQLHGPGGGWPIVKFNSLDVELDICIDPNDNEYELAE